MLSSLKQWVRELILRRRFPNATIHSGVIADRKSRLADFAVLFRNVVVLDSELGAYSYVQAGTAIYSAQIGPFCSIAGDVVIGLGAHPTSMVSTSPVFYDNGQPLPKFFVTEPRFTNLFPRTLIGADVWIGQGALIKAGVRIGVGAVIGAGAVVTKDVAPYVIAGGNPCREIRKRFPDEICQGLLESEWWNLGEADLARLAPYFAEPAALLSALKGD